MRTIVYGLAAFGGMSVLSFLIVLLLFAIEIVGENRRARRAQEQRRREQSTKDERAIGLGYATKELEAAAERVGATWLEKREAA